MCRAGAKVEALVRIFNCLPSSSGDEREVEVVRRGGAGSGGGTRDIIVFTGGVVGADDEGVASAALQARDV